MKKGDKRKRQKARKKQVKRRQASRGVHNAQKTVRGYIRSARDYPIIECWTFDDWQEKGITNVAITRQLPNGNIVFGNYLVDYYCLGLKNTYCNADIPSSRFHSEFMPQLFRTSPAMEISPNLAHELVHGSIAYAAQYGFRPHSDYKLSQYVLDPPEMHPPTGEVEFGKDGKPLYIDGPYDNSRAILRQLERTAGEGNYDYMVQIGGPPPDEWE